MPHFFGSILKIFFGILFIFIFFEKHNFEILNISINNIIHVEASKVLWEIFP